MEVIGEAIARLRAERNYSQKELAAALRSSGIAVTNQAVSKWETGATQPNASQLLAICSVLGVTDVLKAFSGGNAEGILTGLNQRGRELVREYIELLKLSDKYCEAASDRECRILPLYRIPASAGTGQFLDSDDYEPVQVNEAVPASANFGVRLSGNSMEPTYHDGDIIWVMQDKMLNQGEIGLFLWQGEVYCKRYDLSQGRVRLCSLNRNYAPISVDENDDFRIFGRVVAHSRG